MVGTTHLAVLVSLGDKNFTQDIQQETRSILNDSVTAHSNRVLRATLGMGGGGEKACAGKMRGKGQCSISRLYAKLP